MDHTLLHLFRQPHFVKLWLSQTLQSFATVLLQVIVMVNVYRHTDSVFSSALVLAVTAFGSFVGGFLGSYTLHRFSLVHLLSWIGWGRAGFTVILAFFLLSEIHPISLFLMLVTLFFMAAVGSWDQPARFALLSLLVSKKEYMKANGTLHIIHQLFFVAGWGLGGVMAAVLPFYWVILIISSSFLLSGICVRLIRLNDAPVNPSNQSEPAWRTIMKVGVVRNVTLMDMVETLANAVWTSAFILAFTHDVLNKGSEWWGFINASYWVGGIVGSFMVVMITEWVEKRLGWVIAFSALSMSLLTFFFTVNSHAMAALVLCVLMGPLYQARELAQETVLQDVIPPKERANVMAARNALLTPWGGMASIIMGWVADWTDIQSAYMLAAGFYGVTFLVALQPQLRNYRYHAGEKSSISQ